MNCNRNMQFWGGLVIVLLLAQVDAMGMKPPELKCLDQKLELKDMFNGFIECAGKYLPKEDVEAFKDPATPLEKKKEIGKKVHENRCIRVCQMKKQHLLTDDGKLDEPKMGEMVDKVFPEAARATIKTGLAKCYSDHSQSLDDKNNCEAYKPFHECKKKLFMETCKIDQTGVEQMFQ